MLANARRLLTVGCFCIGTNQVDLAGANQRGIPVFNAPFSNTRSVAEMIIAEIVMLARQLGDRVARDARRASGRRSPTGCYEVRGKTLGIVGYGHIGRQVGVLAEAIGMRVVFFDIAAQAADGQQPLGRRRSRSCSAQSDFVTLHVPETPQTQGHDRRGASSRR